jgi:hypothetical protein
MTAERGQEFLIGSTAFFLVVSDALTDVFVFGQVSTKLKLQYLKIDANLFGHNFLPIPENPAWYCSQVVYK